MEKENIIISLGGSLIIPDEIDLDFLRKFRNLILKHLKKKKFFIYVGGGKTARQYQKALAKLGAKASEIDWIGIEITILNAKLIKTLFGKFCEPEIIIDPTRKINRKKDIFIAAGWKPGWSTDYDAVLLAKNLGGIKKIINLTNIDYVYDKNPKKFKNAKILKEIDWKNYRKIVGEKWSPGLSSPFDPISAKLAEKLRMKIIIINGREIERLENVLRNRPFIGTEIG